MNTNRFVRVFTESLKALIEMAGAQPSAKKVDLANHVVTKPSKQDLICILNRHYPSNRENLETWSEDSLFWSYKQGIIDGRIPYDKNRGYLGGACSVPTPPSSSSTQAQANTKPAPSKRSKFAAEEATDVVSRLYKKAGK